MSDHKEIDERIEQLEKLVESHEDMIANLEKRLETQEGHMEFVLTDEKGIYKDD